MPVVQQFLSLSSPPTNVFGLIQYLAQRLPGYDPSEYLRELNSSYIHVWEEVTKLKNHYFTKQKTLTVANAQSTFDLLYNADNGLSGVMSNRLYQVTRIRVLPPAGGLYQTSTGMHFNDPDFLSLAANPSSTPTGTGPYYWALFGRGNVQFSLPLQVGSTLEFTFTFWPVAMAYLVNGTVSSSGATVTGTGTAFTQIVQPDFQGNLPATKDQEEILAELVCNVNQIYAIKAITSDTMLTTLAAVSPVLGASSQYVLATLPEIPREHIRVVASYAMAKMYSVAGDDARVKEWSAIAGGNMQMMKDSLIERQSNNPPRKQRFPYGIGRRNRTFMR